MADDAGSGAQWIAVALNAAGDWDWQQCTDGKVSKGKHKGESDAWHDARDAHDKAKVKA